MKSLKFKAISTIVLLMLCAFNPALAQWERDGELISYTGYPIDGEIIIPDENHGAIVFWKDHHAGYSAIYGQKIDSAGYQLWDQGGSFIGLTTMTYSRQVACTDGDGGAIVAWENYRVAYSDIYAQRITKEGELAWGDSGIAITDFSGYEWGVSIASDGHGGAIIAWLGDENSDGKLLIQRIDGDGNYQYNENGIPLSVVDEIQRGALLEMTSDSNFVCMWIDQRTIGYGPGIYAQKFDIDGNMLWAPEGQAVVYGPSVEVSFLDRMHHVAIDLGGGFYCVWRNYLDYNYKIYMQHVDSYGQYIWTTGGIEISSGDINSKPFLAVDNLNMALVAWGSNPDDLLNCNILNSNGNMRWPGGLPIYYNNMGIWGLTYSIPLEFEVIFVSLDVPRKRIQKVNYDGGLLFGDEGIGFGVPEESISRMAAVTDSIGGAIIFTKRYNSGPLKINRIYANGHVGGDTLTSIDENNVPLGYDLSLSNYPNPFNSSTNIIINSPNEQSGDLILYDILGRQVSFLANLKVYSGNLTYNLNLSKSSDIPSGTYFLVLKTPHTSVKRKITYLK